MPLEFLTLPTYSSTKHTVLAFFHNDLGMRASAISTLDKVLEAVDMTDLIFTAYHRLYFFQILVHTTEPQHTQLCSIQFLSNNMRLSSAHL
jgi:hypothetical protein